jgi:hypothetical protein
LHGAAERAVGSGRRNGVSVNQAVWRSVKCRAGDRGGAGRTVTGRRLSTSMFLDDFAADASKSIRKPIEVLANEYAKPGHIRRDGNFRAFE